jgi:RTX calcium-binding nonapeptide repeat (4 copies)
MGAIGNDNLGGRGGVDTLDGGADNDMADYLNAAGAVTASILTQAVSNDGDGANDVLISIENLRGSNFADSLTGDGNANTLLGQDGADVIGAAAGNDLVEGGAGNDSIIAGDGADVFDGGADVDTLDYSGSAQTSINVILNGSTSAAVTVTGDSNDTVRNIENIVGTTGADTIFGDALVNTLTGGLGNDTLSGGAGADTLDGGGDFDTVDYSGAAGAVTVNLGSSVASNDGNGSSDTLLNFEHVRGSGLADSITGGASDNTLTGGLGNDVLTGRGGNDLLDGGSDDDTADYSSAAGAVIATLAGAQASVDGDGGVDTFASIEHLTGSTFGDQLTGDGGANTLTGNAGDDVLAAGGGNDRVLGGTGNDTITAGSGADTIDGEGDVDTLDYSGQGSITAGSFAGLTGTITEGGLTDSISSIENFILTASDDAISFDTDSITALSSVDAEGGSDTILVANGGGVDDLTDDDIDGDRLALVFRDIEELDFRNTDLTGGDTFDIGNLELDAMASGTSLTIRVDTATIALTDINPLTQGGASISSDSTVGNIRTISWSDGTQLIVNGGP